MNGQRSRHGMTLIELLVVIGLISVLAALAAMMLPSLRQKDNAGKAATALVANLSIAKQQALRDQAPRGIRFIPDYDLDATGNTCRELQYIELPAPIVPRSNNPAQATLMLTPAGAPGGPNVAASLSGAVDNNWLTLGVQKDDFLYVSAFGRTYVARVLADPVGANMTVQAQAPGYVFPGQSAAMTFTEGFQIIRRPRALVGEENVQLPPKMVIRLDNSLPSTTGVWNALSDIPGTKERDIIFLPSGQVSGCPEGKIVLWVQQVDDTNTGKMNLVVVYTRTGQIVIQPVAVGADPYAFTKDGQGSGL